MRFKGFPYYWGAIATTKCIKAILFVFLPKITLIITCFYQIKGDGDNAKN